MIAIVVGLGLSAMPAVTAAQDGQIQCNVTENGAPSNGTVAVEQNGRTVASGSCNRSLSVPAGKSRVTLRLEGLLDNPAQTIEVVVAAGKTTPVTADFKTALLEVRIEAKGQRGTGLVAVEKDGKRLGTLGSGVAARLSAGAYEVVVKLGGQEQRHAVDLRPGQRRVVRAQF
jgi:hypothetical protein